MTVEFYLITKREKNKKILCGQQLYKVNGSIYLRMDIWVKILSIDIKYIITKTRDMHQFTYRGHGQLSSDQISKFSGILMCQRLIQILHQGTLKIMG